MSKRKVVLLGAAGRDFHNFNVFFRNNPDYEVVAFTAAQIPDIADRVYPPELAGPLYPDGIPIYKEEDLSEIIRNQWINEVIFAYSDVNYEHVMRLASIAMALGTDFRLMGPDSTMIQSTKPVISVCAVRTGCGKSQTTRKILSLLRDRNKKAVLIRHPMPYANRSLLAQKNQRFATVEDLTRYKATIEEIEEFEHHIANQAVVYCGVDYGDMLASAEKEADVIIWDGGNNDFSFYKPDIHIVVTDPHRVGNELKYFPGEVNLRSADILIINKIDSARPEDVQKLKENIRRANPRADLIEAESPVFVETPEAITGKKVLVVEDGPTLTHGEMKIGAGTIAAEKYKAAELIDPRPYVVGKIKETIEKYPHIGKLLPAMGYSDQQIKDLEDTINKIPADLVIIGTPIDLRRIIQINKPSVRVSYDLQEIGENTLENLLFKKYASKI